MSANSLLAARLRDLHHPTKYFNHPDVTWKTETLDGIRSELKREDIEFTALEEAVVTWVFYCAHCLEFAKPTDAHLVAWPLPDMALWPCPTALIIAEDDPGLEVAP